MSLSKLKNDNITNEFIIFSIPIFSSDNKKAYIEIDIYSKMYRHGESYFLEKNKGKWRVIYSATNWSAC